MGVKSVNTHVKIVARNGKNQVVNKKFYLQNKLFPGQGGHIPAKIKFPVFSLSFPCAK